MTEVVHPHLLPIIKDSETVRKTILVNIVKMLVEREWLDRKDWLSESLTHISKPSAKLEKFVQNRNENDQYSIKIKNGPKDSVDIILISQKVISITSTPIVTDFLKSSDNYKLIIVDDVSDKASTHYSGLPNVEIFKKPFFMINITEYICSPKYEILTEDETKQLLEEYDLKRKELKKMFESDPISKYYNLKKGQVVRIIRPSRQSGEVVDYRIVTKKLALTRLI